MSTIYISPILYYFKEYNELKKNRNLIIESDVNK